jgi:hypothetical protein
VSHRGLVNSSLIDDMSYLRDPEGLLTDAELISVLQRAWLLPRDGPPDPVTEAKFSLYSTVGDEG